MIKKGKVSTIGTEKATVLTGDLISPEIKVPARLQEKIRINDWVAYVVFEDGTGTILELL